MACFRGFAGIASLVACLSVLGFAASPYLIKDINPINDDPASGANIWLWTTLGDKALFMADDGGGRAVWASDATEAGTLMLRRIPHLPPDGTPFCYIDGVPWWARLGENLLFSASDEEHGSELWVTDGTSSGTFLLKDIFPGPGDSDIDGLIVLADRVLFSANDAHGPKLWITDGSPEGTVLLRDITPCNLQGSARCGTRMLFWASGAEFEWRLWVTDGTSDGTMLLKDIHGESSFAPVAGGFVFAANDGVHGIELWFTDCTPDGTILLKDIMPGPEHSSPSVFVSSGGRVAFRATTLWVTDGTSEGTVPLVPFCVGVPKPFRGGFLFTPSLSVGLSASEIWFSQGTPEGTTVLKDFPDCSSPGCDDYPPQYLSSFGGHAFFSADNGEHGWNPWVTDGTTAGTIFLKDVGGRMTPATDDFARLFPITEFESKFVFACGSSAYEKGIDLWISDGTPAGTELIRQFPGDHGMYGVSTLKFLSSEKALFFVANDGTHGCELWALPASNPLAVNFLRGDTNSDSETNISDPVFNLNYQFALGPTPTCLKTADVNDDGLIDLADPIFQLNYMFVSGPTPPPPLTECGIDPTADTLSCEEYAPCR